MSPHRARLVRHARSPDGIARALGWTLVGALLPGSALLVAGRKGGAAILAGFGALVAVAFWLATSGRRTALLWAVDPEMLLLGAVLVVVLALAWVLVVVAGYVALLPRRAPRRRRRTGAVVVLALCLAGAVPAVAAAHLAVQQRDLVQGVFARDGQSATVQELEEAEDPFGGKPRINVLLLGGDGGEGRDGVRTDTVMVASIDTVTGDTTLVSLPRNLEDLPFPATSPLAEAYPDGFDAGSEDESLLNAVYRNGPQMYPDILGPTDNPGADFLKLGVGEALGLTIDYYVLVNLDGFSRLVDALGGVTVDVNYYVPIGGNPGTGRLPDGYIAPGPDQRMDGTTALAFARGRFGLSDYERMDRQRCVVDAIAQQADPLTMATRYGELVDTAQDIISTDLPQDLVDDAVEVALRVKDAQVRSLVLDNSVIEPAYPDYDEIRRLVREATAPPPAAVAPPTGGPTAALPGADPGAVSPPAPAAPDGSGDPSVAASAGRSPIDDAADACAYDPVQAQAALAEGEPPTHGD
jgi:LCP family protein required for cell wall assembly